MAKLVSRTMSHSWLMLSHFMDLSSFLFVEVVPFHRSVLFFLLFVTFCVFCGHSSAGLVAHTAEQHERADDQRNILGQRPEGMEPEDRLVVGHQDADEEQSNGLQDQQ